MKRVYSHQTARRSVPVRLIAAYNTWLATRTGGVEHVRARVGDATFHRSKRLLFKAGLTWANLHASNLVPLGRHPIEIGQPVHS